MLFTVVVILELYSAFFSNVPFVPVPFKAEEKIIEALKLNDQSVFYDLGCGDGRILILASQKYPEMKAVGLEISFLPFLLAKWKCRKYKNIKILRENFYKYDFSNATHIYCYLYPKIVNDLIKIAKEKCRPGTRLVTCDFIAKDYTYTETISIEGNGVRGKNLYVYSI